MNDFWVTKHTKTTPYLMHSKDANGKVTVRPATEEEYILFSQVKALTNNVRELLEALRSTRLGK